MHIAVGEIWFSGGTVGRQMDVLIGTNYQDILALSGLGVLLVAEGGIGYVLKQGFSCPR